MPVWNSLYGLKEGQSGFALGALAVVLKPYVFLLLFLKASGWKNFRIFHLISLSVVSQLWIKICKVVMSSVKGMSLSEYSRLNKSMIPTRGSTGWAWSCWFENKCVRIKGEALSARITESFIDWQTRFNTSLYFALLAVSYGTRPQSSGAEKRICKTTGITIQQLILGYGTFTFSTLDKRDIATWRQWVPTSCLLLREAIFGFLKM